MATSKDAAGPARPQAGKAIVPESASVGGRDAALVAEDRGLGRVRVVCAVPFTLRRSSDLWDAGSYTTKTETAHGLLRLEPKRLVIQWRLAVRTEQLGQASWTRKDVIEPVRETAVPLADVSGAGVSRGRWSFLRGPRLVVTAADLVTFDEIAGGHGLKLKHPAKLVLRIKRADRLLAEEFAAELALALARLPRNGAGFARDAAADSVPAHGSHVAAPSPSAASASPNRGG